MFETWSEQKRGKKEKKTEEVKIARTLKIKMKKERVSFFRDDYLSDSPFLSFLSFYLNPFCPPPPLPFTVVIV